MSCRLEAQQSAGFAFLFSAALLSSTTRIGPPVEKSERPQGPRSRRTAYAVHRAPRAKTDGCRTMRGRDKEAIVAAAASRVPPILLCASTHPLPSMLSALHACCVLPVPCAVRAPRRRPGFQCIDFRHGQALPRICPAPWQLDAIPVHTTRFRIMIRRTMSMALETEYDTVVEGCDRRSSTMHVSRYFEKELHACIILTFVPAVSAVLQSFHRQLSHGKNNHRRDRKNLFKARPPCRTTCPPPQFWICPI